MPTPDQTPETNPVWEIQGVIQLKIFGASFRLSAGNKSSKGKDSETTFSGELANVKMDALVKFLETELKVSNVPVFIKTFEIEKLFLSYSKSTESKDFSFNCVGKFQVVPGTNVVISIFINIKTDTATNKTTVTFNGKLDINGYEFDVAFGSGKDENIFVATYSSDRPIVLKSIISAIDKKAGAQISDKIQLKLDCARFIYFKGKETISEAQYAFGIKLGNNFKLKELPVLGDKLPADVDLSISNLQLLFASATFTEEQINKINILISARATAEAEAKTDTTAKALALAEIATVKIATATLSKGIVLLGRLEIKTGANAPPKVIEINTSAKAANGGASGANGGTGASRAGALGVVSLGAIGGGAMTTQTPTVVSGDIVGESGSQIIEDTSIKWFNVNKTLGPARFERIGVSFSNNVLSLALDASMSMGPATVGMQGLTAGSSLSEFKPVFGLQGFSISLETASLKIGGGFLKTKYQPQGNLSAAVDAYFGTVIVKFGEFGLTAIGGNIMKHTIKSEGKCDVDVPDSFFLYASVNLTLGGPPFFFVTGFAGGFGINSQLILPTMTELPNYILLPANAPKQGDKAAPKDTVSVILPKIKKCLQPKAGEYWIAAGVSFTSFEMIKSFAVLTVSFGSSIEIALLGSSKMSFPKGTKTPIAYIEIAIKAVYSEKDGLISVEGVLSQSSYIFGSFCQLTGGFAFYIWFNPPQIAGRENPKKGDFVVTIGGYHPLYTPPAYYPTVPRLGINFKLGPLQILGQAYFALTPSMFMAGIDISATWDSCIVKAWFSVGAHFLIAWAPFHYDAQVYISVGCKVNLGLFTPGFSIGANLHIWGPPFGGVAVIDLSIITFTIEFGEPVKLPDPIGWKSFKELFLPADTVETDSTTKKEIKRNSNIIKISVPEGLTNTDGDNWIVDPNQFLIHISTAIPATEIKINETSQQQEKKLNIRPMKLADIQSTLSLKITSTNEIEFTNAIDLQSVPSALWGENGELKVNDEENKFIEQIICGVNLRPMIRFPAQTTEVDEKILLYQRGYEYYYKFVPLVLNKDYSITIHEKGDNKLLFDITTANGDVEKIEETGCVLTSLENKRSRSERAAILKNLSIIGFETYKEVKLDTFAKETALTSWPEVVLLTKIS